MKSSKKRRTKPKKINNNTHHRAILRGLVWVALFVFLGKIAGAAKEMAIAYRYGVSEQVDAYLFLFNLVSWPISVWLSVVSFMLVPTAASLQENNPTELPRFRAELLGFALLLGINLSLICWFGLPFLLNSPGIGLSPTTVAIAREIIPQITALIPLGILVGLFSSWTLASGRHANTLLESVPALAILAAVLALPHYGVWPLVWGTLIGFVAHVFALGIPLAWRREMELPRFTSRSPQWPHFWKGFGVLLIGSGLGSLNGVVDQFFAAQLDSGSITRLSYANRIMALILGLGATAISRATLPIFSKIKSQTENELKRIGFFWMWLMLLLGIVAMSISWWVAPWAVKLLFERGAFSAADSLVVTDLFRFGLAQVPFYFAALVLVTLLATNGKHKLMAISGASNLFVKAAANYYLLPIFGINAIILSSGVMYGVSLVLLYIFARTSIKEQRQTRII